jgi:hypothetical protein
MEFICVSPNVLRGAGVLASDASFRAPCEGVSYYPTWTVTCLSRAGQPASQRDYPTPAEIFEEIGCHLACWWRCICATHPYWGKNSHEHGHRAVLRSGGEVGAVGSYRPRSGYKGNLSGTSGWICGYGGHYRIREPPPGLRRLHRLRPRDGTTQRTRGPCGRMNLITASMRRLG